MKTCPCPGWERVGGMGDRIPGRRRCHQKQGERKMAHKRGTWKKENKRKKKEKGGGGVMGAIVFG